MIFMSNSNKLSAEFPAFARGSEMPNILFCSGHLTRVNSAFHACGGNELATQQGEMFTQFCNRSWFRTSSFHYRCHLWFILYILFSVHSFSSYLSIPQHFRFYSFLSLHVATACESVLLQLPVQNILFWLRHALSGQPY
jgi:hypothetical protein